MDMLKPRLSDEDVLNAIITDLLADQTKRAMCLGYSHGDIARAATRGLMHGLREYEEDIMPPEITNES